MCNPRRVRVQATADIEQAWEETVNRTVELRQTLTREARVQQSLVDTLPEPVLQALEAALAAGCDGWSCCDGLYWYSVPGGSMSYDPRDRQVEIVARLDAEVQAGGTAGETLTGVVKERIETQGDATYYTDWGTKTEADARREAEQAAQRHLDQCTQELLRQAQARAAAERGDAVEAEARRRAEAALGETAARRGAQLDQQVQAGLRALGARCRLALNQLIAMAYRQAVLDYVRRQGAHLVQNEERDGVIDIEFDLA